MGPKARARKALERCRRECANGALLGVVEAFVDALPDDPPEPAKAWPCSRCGIERTKEQGGEIFTMCDVCWEEGTESPEQPAPIVRWMIVDQDCGAEHYRQHKPGRLYDNEGKVKLIEAGHVAKRLREIAKGLSSDASVSVMGAELALLDLARELEADS